MKYLAPYIIETEQVTEFCKEFEQKNPDIIDYYIFRLGDYYRAYHPKYKLKVEKYPKQWDLNWLYKSKKIK